MQMAELPKLQTQIDVKPIQPRLSLELTAEELLREQRVPFPFFRKLSQGKEWVISLFVLFHIVIFAATMVVNGCWANSQSQCLFQPLSENPFLGPSASGLDGMGALRHRYLAADHLWWRIFMSPLLHAGLIHLITGLASVVYVGLHLEQEFGPSRIGAIYIVSAISGSLLAILFLQDRPSVTSSGALFGLLGASLSGLIWNWKVYTQKFAALVAFFLILTLNAATGLMPFVNNFSSIGGFVSGFLLGFVLLFKPQVGKLPKNKVGLFEYNVKSSFKTKLREKFDRPVLRSICLVILSLLLAGAIIAVVQGINVNKNCGWCQYIDCVPSKWWSCSDETMQCEKMASKEHLTLTCSNNGNFKEFPFANISQARMEDLCYMICL